MAPTWDVPVLLVFRKILKNFLGKTFNVFMIERKARIRKFKLNISKKEKVVDKQPLLGFSLAESLSTISSRLVKQLYRVNQKNGMHKIFILQNRNICKQDTVNLCLSLSFILSLRNQIFTKNDPNFQQKSLHVFTSPFDHNFVDILWWKFLGLENKMSKRMTDKQGWVQSILPQFLPLYTIFAIIIFCLHNYCNYCTQLKQLLYENFNSKSYIFTSNLQ